MFVPKIEEKKPEYLPCIDVDGLSEDRGDMTIVDMIDNLEEYLLLLIQVLNEMKKQKENAT
jgi:hypothetical protein